MKLKPLFVAIIAAFSASAFAGGAGQGAQPQSQSGSGNMSQAQQSGQQAQSPEVVKQVQQGLKEKGIDAGPVDGQWGPLTQKGVKQFQQQQNIQASGRLDQQTLAALGIQEGSSAMGSSSKSSGGAASSSSGSSSKGSSAPATGAASGGSAGSSPAGAATGGGEGQSQ